MRYGWFICWLFLVACQTAVPPDVVLEAPTPTIIPTATAETGVASAGVAIDTNVVPTPTPLPVATATPPPTQDSLNDWLTVVPPADWTVVNGPNGALLAREVSQVPHTPFIHVHRWDTSLPLSSWTAYLPDGIQERNSHATIALGYLEWDGVFIVNDAGDYRAFYAVSKRGAVSYSLLVYVPTGGIQAAHSVFDREAASMNAILRTMQVTP